MAMEVGKKLEASALIITLIILFALAASTLSFNSYLNGVNPTTSLTTRVLDVRPSKNGLVRISVHKEPVSQAITSSWTQAGRETALWFGF